MITRSALTAVAMLLATGGVATAASPTGEPASRDAPTSAGRPAPAGPTPAQILAAAPAADWRAVDPARMLYLDLADGRVVIELAPEFAPRHVDNLSKLVRARYFDGLAIVRVQDNYVVQWGDPDGRRALGDAASTLAPEFDRAAAGLPFVTLADGDVYAPEAGFVDGFPAARDPASGRAWLAHCYGMVGVGRDAAADSGNAAELYVVIGHAPRHLDRNVTLIGRVLAGIERLSALPRGTGHLGFHERAEQRVPIARVRFAADVPAAERADLEVLRSDSATFATLVDARRNRRDGWTLRPAGRIEVCNAPLPVRVRPRP